MYGTFSYILSIDFLWLDMTFPPKFKDFGHDFFSKCPKKPVHDMLALILNCKAVRFPNYEYFADLLTYYLVQNKRTMYDLKKPNDFAGGSGGYAP